MSHLDALAWHPRAGINPPHVREREPASRAQLLLLGTRVDEGFRLVSRRQEPPSHTANCRSGIFRTFGWVCAVELQAKRGFHASVNCK